MERWLRQYSEVAYLAMRVVFAFLFIFHAPQKLFGWYGGPQFPVMSLRGLAAAIEIVSNPLIALGLFTPFAALLASGEMAFAYFIVHYPRPGWPIVNRGELVVLWCFAYLYIATRGGGKYSLDHLLRKKPA